MPQKELTRNGYHQGLSSTLAAPLRHAALKARAARLVDAVIGDTPMLRCLVNKELREPIHRLVRSKISEPQRRDLLYRHLGQQARTGVPYRVDEKDSGRRTCSTQRLVR